MKGQNLRLLVNAKCVAAARECSWHQGLQLEDASTKDNVSDFQTQVVTSKNWDASASALYVNNNEQLFLSDNFEDVDGKSFYAFQFVSTAGQRFVFVSKDGTPIHAYIATANYVITANGIGSHVSLICGFTGGCRIALDNEEDWENVNIFKVAADDACDFETLFDAYNNETPVTVKLATTEGEKNREVDDDVLFSNGIITDLQLVSTNKQLVTFSIQIQGCGEVE